MSTEKTPTVCTDRGNQPHEPNGHVHPLFKSFLSSICPPVKGVERSDGADLAFDSTSEKERWS